MRRVMPEGRRFKKGQSGNPGGRPKVIADIQELARQKTPEAIETLTDIMINGKQEAARVSAARELLDRGYGRALQTTQIEQTITKRAEDMTDDAATIAAQELPKAKQEEAKAQLNSWNGGDDTAH